MNAFGFYGAQPIQQQAMQQAGQPMGAPDPHSQILAQALQSMAQPQSAPADISQGMAQALMNYGRGQDAQQPAVKPLNLYQADPGPGTLSRIDPNQQLGGLYQLAALMGGQ